LKPRLKLWSFTGSIPPSDLSEKTENPTVLFAPSL
jgi:hypothetical protein